MDSDHRSRAFQAKFNSAGQHLSVEPNEIVSLKIRENVQSYSEYHKLLHSLEMQGGLHWSEVDGDFQGKGYLIDHDGQKIILVEHETGLEVLYIAGSIASIVGLVPFILQVWSGIRGHLDRRHPVRFQGIEVRRINPVGVLFEETSTGLAGPSAFPLSVLNTALSAAARVFDSEIQSLRQELRSVGERLAAIEQAMTSDEPAKSKKSKKKT